MLQKIQTLLFILFLINSSLLAAQGTNECDLRNLGDAENSYYTVGQEDWLQIIELPIPTGFGQPCEFNLNISGDASNDHYAYFAGHHTGTDESLFFNYSFSLKDLSSMLSELQPKQEVEIFTVGRLPESGPEDVMMSMKISLKRSNEWNIDVYWNPSPFNSIIIGNFTVPKLIHNNCECAKIKFKWSRLPMNPTGSKFSITVAGQTQERIIRDAPVPNFTKLGYISSNTPLQVNNQINFGVVSSQ